VSCSSTVVVLILYSPVSLPGITSVGTPGLASVERSEDDDNLGSPKEDG
jgi:hypothetical protein